MVTQKIRVGDTVTADGYDRFVVLEVLARELDGRTQEIAKVQAEVGVRYKYRNGDGIKAFFTWALKKINE